MPVCVDRPYADKQWFFMFVGHTELETQAYNHAINMAFRGYIQQGSMGYLVQHQQREGDVTGLQMWEVWGAHSATLDDLTHLLPRIEELAALERQALRELWSTCDPKELARMTQHTRLSPHCQKEDQRLNQLARSQNPTLTSLDMAPDMPEMPNLFIRH